MIHSDALLQIDDLVKKIRADISNLKNGNGNAVTVDNRINKRLEKIDVLIEKNTPEKLGATIMDRVETVKAQYLKETQKQAA